MSKATFIPAVEPIYDVVVEGVPASVTLNISPREATVLMGLLAHTTGKAGYPVYSALSQLAENGRIVRPNSELCRPAGRPINTDSI